jgi:ATP-dependent Zn protease
MNQDALVGILVSWFPMLLLLAVLVLFLRRMTQNLRATERQIKVLERIAGAIENQTRSGT